jgi:hypothetical protein
MSLNLDLCPATFQELQTLELEKDPHQKDRTKTEDYARSFFPLIKKIYHADTWYQGYKWQMGHPIREQVMRQICPNTFEAYMISYREKSICTVTARNVFSIFVENSVYAQDSKFLSSFTTYEKETIENFKQEIERIRGFQGKKGGAFYCSIGASWMRAHEFVLDFAPDGKFYIYQSYLSQYSLDECLKDHKGQDEEEVIKKLELIASKTITEHTEERDNAFFDLFHAKDPLFQQLDFFFVSAEYDRDAIPKAPNQLSTAERMESIVFST